MTNPIPQLSAYAIFRLCRRLDDRVDRQVDPYVAGDYSRDGLVDPCLSVVREQVGDVYLPMLDGKKSWFR